MTLLDMTLIASFAPTSLVIVILDEYIYLDNVSAFVLVAYKVLVSFVSAFLSLASGVLSLASGVLSSFSA